MGILLTAAFLLLKVPFSLLFDFTIGVLMLIYLGDIFGVLGVGLLTGINNIQLGIEVYAVATTINQITDQMLAPRIFGDLIGLNSIWIIISLLLGAKLGGVLGLVLAVPWAGVVKRMLKEIEITPSDRLTEA